MGVGGRSEKWVSKTNPKGGQYLSLGDPGHQIPDMAISRNSFPGPRIGRRITILREPSTTVLEVIATHRVPSFHSLPGDTGFIYHGQ